VDGEGHCFSCNKHFFNGDRRTFEVDSISDKFSFEYLPLRGITRETMEKFNVLTKVDNSKPDSPAISVGFPYYVADSEEQAYKVRFLASKDFTSVGPMGKANLFGKELFPMGSARAITITEGEFDAMAAYQMTGSKYPVVSVRGASSAKKDCAAVFEYLNGFEKIYLCFDMDEAGQKATKEVASMFDFNKVYHVKMDGCKDANEYLQKGLGKEFVNAWFNAKRFLPEGISSSKGDFVKILEEQGDRIAFPYPFPTLERMLEGLAFGETVLFTALEGRGKTEILRAIEYKILKDDPEAKIGVIHLEETQARTLQGFAGYELGQPVHRRNALVSKAEVHTALDKLLGDGERLHLYGHFGSDDPDVIINTIRFLVAVCGCKYIFLDHISIVISGLVEEDERKALDKISTQLAMLANDLEFCLVMVSHVNDHGQTRGSRNISKVAHKWVHLERDVKAADERERNTTYLTVNKNRGGHETGPAGRLYFDPNTYILTEIEDDKREGLPPV
jgi:twinkle protein